MSEMSLIQPAKFRAYKMVLFKMPHYEMLPFKRGAFEMGVIVSTVGTSKWSDMQTTDLFLAFIN